MFSQTRENQEEILVRFYNLIGHRENNGELRHHPRGRQ